MKLSEVHFYSILAHGKLQYVDEFMWFKHFAEKTLQSSFQYSIKINEQKIISQNDKINLQMSLNYRKECNMYITILTVDTGLRDRKQDSGFALWLEIKQRLNCQGIKQALKKLQSQHMTKISPYVTNAWFNETCWSAPHLKVNQQLADFLLTLRAMQWPTLPARLDSLICYKIIILPSHMISLIQFGTNKLENP